MKSFLQFLREDADAIVNFQNKFLQDLQKAIGGRGYVPEKGIIMPTDVGGPRARNWVEVKSADLNPDDNINIMMRGAYTKNPENNLDKIQLDINNSDISTPNPILHHEAEHYRNLGKLSDAQYDLINKKESNVPYQLKPREMSARRGEAYGQMHKEADDQISKIRQNLQRAIEAQPTPPGWLISDDPIQSKGMPKGQHFSPSRNFMADVVKAGEKLVNKREKEEINFGVFDAIRNMAKKLMPLRFNIDVIDDEIEEIGHKKSWEIARSKVNKQYSKAIQKQISKVASVARATFDDMNKPGGKIDQAMAEFKWMGQVRAPRMGVKTPVQGSYVPTMTAVTPSDPIGIANMVATTFGAADTPTNRNNRAKSIAGNPNASDEKADADAAIAGQYSDSGMEYTPGVNSPGTVDRVQALRIKELQDYQEKTGKDLLSQKVQMFAPWGQ